MDRTGAANASTHSTKSVAATGTPSLRKPMDEPVVVAAAAAVAQSPEQNSPTSPSSATPTGLKKTGERELM